MGTQRKKYTAEFKAEAVKRIEEEGLSVSQVAGELGLGPQLVRNWRNEIVAAGSAEALARSKADAAEAVRLRRDVKRLAEENEILRKATAFFAQRAEKR